MKKSNDTLIRFLSPEEIDKSRWDAVLTNCENRLPYAYSWYLDLVTPGWGALIEDDYRFFMPLPLKKKAGYLYVPRPAYTQQLGIFGQEIPDPFRVKAFINAVPSEIRLADLSLNSFNDAGTLGISMKMSANYELNLNRPYDELVKMFSENSKRNISRSGRENLKVSNSHKPEELLNLKWKYRPSGMKLEQLILASSIIEMSLKTGKGEIWKAADINGELLASVFFLKDDQRYIYLVSASSEKGKEKGAMFLILDEFIRSKSGSDIILDFEGSEIAGIARFFSGFGAVNRPYPRLRINRLPWYINLFIR